MRFTQMKVAKIEASDKPRWISDDEIRGLKLYVGKESKIWYYNYRGSDGKKAFRKLGSVDALTVAQAREMVKKLAGQVVQGENIRKEKPIEKLTLGDFLTNTYFPLRCNELKSAKETARKITSNFKKFFNRPIDELDGDTFDKWIKQRIESGAKAATANKIVAALKAALNWGVKTKRLATNPIEHVAKRKELDSEQKVRFLTVDERERLENALITRENRIREQNAEKNAVEFADYLYPAVLLSLNTGIRRNALFNLKWSDIDLPRRHI
ncbi:MAG: integrase family protein [Synergistaceae bacterium]|nr:integrase family protein [Synergistaceae bacterium]